MSGNTAPRQNNWPEIGGHDIWKVTKIKVKKFGPPLVAPKITEELRKQKSNRNGWISFCKRFQICSFMSQKKSFQVSVPLHWCSLVPFPCVWLWGYATEEYFLETRVQLSVAFNTYPIWIFEKMLVFSILFSRYYFSFDCYFCSIVDRCTCQQENIWDCHFFHKYFVE